jgi:glycosyltransferase involved in cell wall biosynthesis
MIKIYNPSVSKQTLGGGHTFRRNLEKSLIGQAEFVDNWQDCDIFLISSVTIVDKAEVHQSKAAGKKIILRVDNMPRKSRNRGMSPHERMREYAELASEVVYQSQWAQRWLGDYIGKQGVVIYNAADSTIFYPPSIKLETPIKTYLITQYNRDENKRTTQAFDIFTEIWKQNHNHKLIVVGNYSPELVAVNFDLYRGEQVEYLGIISDPKAYADVLRRVHTLIYPTYSDACPNTVIEAWMCGLDVYHTGWEVIVELFQKWRVSGREHFSLPRLGREYLEVFNKAL